MKKFFKNIFVFFSILFLIFLTETTQISATGNEDNPMQTTAYDTDEYNQGDIDIINNMILNNGLSATIDDPASWDFVTEWVTINGKKHVRTLFIKDKGLFGNLDANGFEHIITLNCSKNNLASLDVSGLTSLKFFSCSENELPVLDVSTLTSIRELYCRDNNLTTIDVRGLSKLYYLSASGNTIYDLSSSKDLTITKGLPVVSEAPVNKFYTNDISTPITSFEAPSGMIVICGKNANANMVDNMNPAYQNGSNTINATFNPTGNDTLSANIGTLTSQDGTLQIKDYTIELLGFENLVGADVELLPTQTQVLDVDFENELLSGYTPNFTYSQISGSDIFSFDPITKQVTALKPGTGQIKITASTLEDTSLTSEMIINVTVYPQVYNFIQGSGQEYNGNQSQVLFTVDGDYSKLSSVEINGTILDPSNYVAKANGSNTEIYLSLDYVNSLQNDTYTIRAVYNDGVAQTTFTVNTAKMPKPSIKPPSAPNTGDTSNPISNSLAMMGLTITVFAFLMFKNTYKKN